MAVPHVDAKKLMGRYELVSELAQSYLGSLWAVRVTTGEGEGLVATVRRVTVSAGSDPEVVDRLAEAAWTSMEVHHELVPKVADVILQGNEIGVVTDYVEGLPLRAVSRQSTIWRKPVPSAVALRVGADVLEVLVELHRQARDFGDLAADVYGGITPDSVLVGTDGRIRVLDVVVAGAGSAIPALRDDPERVAYAAPEQLGTGMLPDARTDLFCVGILLWELLSNRRLFVGFGESAAQKVLLQKIPRLDEIKRSDGDLPLALADLVARALDRDPRGRPQSADEMLAAVRAAGLPVATPEETSAYLLQIGERDIDRQRADLGVDRTTQPGARRHLSAQFRSIRPPSTPVPRRAPAPTEASAPAGGGAMGTRRRKQTLLGVAPMGAVAPPAQKMPPKPAAATPADPMPAAAAAKPHQATMLGLAPQAGPPPAPSRAATPPAPAAPPESETVDDRWSVPGSAPPPVADAPEPPAFKRREAGAKRTLLGVAPPGPGSHYPSLPTPFAAGLPVGAPIPAPEDVATLESIPPEDEARTVVAPTPFTAASFPDSTPPPPGKTPADAAAPGAGSSALAAAIAQAAAAAPAPHQSNHPAAQAAESVEDRVSGVDRPLPILHDLPTTKVVEPKSPASGSRFGLGFLAGVATTLVAVAIGALVVALVGGKFARRTPAEVASASAEPRPSASATPKTPAKAPEPVPSSSAVALDAGQPAVEDAGADTGAVTEAGPPVLTAPTAPVARPVARPAPKKAYVPDEI